MRGILEINQREGEKGARFRSRDAILWGGSNRGERGRGVTHLLKRWRNNIPVGRETLRVHARLQ